MPQTHITRQRTQQETAPAVVPPSTSMPAGKPAKLSKAQRELLGESVPSLAAQGKFNRRQTYAALQRRGLIGPDGNLTEAGIAAYASL